MSVISYKVCDLLSSVISGEWGVEPLSEGSVNIIRTTNFLNNGQINFNNIVNRFVDKSIVAKKKLLPGDLIIEKSGGSPNQPVGRVVYFENADNEIYLCNNFTAILRPNANISSKYLFYSLFFKHLTKRTLNYQNKTTGIINLQLNRYLESEKIPLPSLDEQHRIVKILDLAQSLIEKRKQAIAYLDDYIKAVFLDMFGDPLSKTPKFRIVNLEDIAIKEKNSIVDGPFGSSLNNNDYYDDGIPIIRIANVRDTGFCEDDFKYITETKYDQLIRSKIEFNDILIPRVGNSIGKLCLFNKKYKALLSTTGVAKASIDTNSANINFILYQMRLPQYSEYIWNQAEGGGQPYLNLKKIKNFKILLPPMDLQILFSEIAITIESVKQKMLTQLKELEDNFKAQLQRAFRGGMF